MGQKKETPPPEFRLPPDQAEGVIEERLRSYQLAKESTLAILPHLYDSNIYEKKHAPKIEECGTWLRFNHYYTVDQTRLTASNFCRKHLLCDLCALRKSALRVQVFIPKLQQLLLEDPDLEAYLVTFTVKNEDDLLERYLHLVSNFRKLVKKRHNAITLGRKNTVMRFVAGGTMQVEIKIGEGSGQWHCHIHSIFLIKKGLFTLHRLVRKNKYVRVPLDFENQLRQEWSASTKDSHMVDVRKIEIEDDEDRFGAICEAHKYALKPGNMTPQQRIQAAHEMYGRQMYSTFGNLYGLKINPDLTDDIESELELLPYIQLTYHYNNKGYILREVIDGEILSNVSGL